MCGRYADTRRKKVMLARVGLQADLAFTPRYNIAPTQEASIVALGEGWEAGAQARPLELAAGLDEKLDNSSEPLQRAG